MQRALARMFDSCPFCHRPFEGQILDKQQIDHSELSKASDFPRVATPGGMAGAIAQGNMYSTQMFWPTSEERTAIAEHPETFVTYKIQYKCKHCGKEWTRISVEEIPIPREYVEDEEEKSEADAEIEAEEAREEEYNR